MAPKLSLKKERLAELTTDDLHHVVGGAQTRDCIDTLLCHSWQQACTTAMSCSCQPTWNCA